MDHWRSGIGLVAVFWLSACGSEPRAGAEAEAISALDVAALPSNGGILFDLRPEDSLVHFDHRFGPIDYRRIGLVCPDGTGMPLDVWLMLIAERIGVEHWLVEEQLASLSNAARGTADEASSGECLDCDPCPDGAEICRWTCGEGDSSGESVCPDGQPDCRSADYWIGVLGEDDDDSDWNGGRGGDDDGTPDDGGDGDDGDGDGASPWAGGGGDGGDGGGGGGDGGGGGASGGGDRDGW